MSIKVCNKHKHPSIGKAMAHLRSIKSKNPNYKGTIYNCFFCNSYHIGRSMKHNKYRN